MPDSLVATITAAGAGLSAQSVRMRVVSENIANANVTAKTPGGDPYRRKMISFESDIDGRAGVDIVRVGDISTDARSFRVDHEPGHPAADPQGYVKLPNVDIMMELADMREANRSYLANLQMIKQAREAITMTLDLLRSS